MMIIGNEIGRLKAYGSSAPSTTHIPMWDSATEKATYLTPDQIASGATSANIATSGTIAGTNTVTTTAPSTTREIYGKVNVTFAGAVTPGAGTGSLAGMRGEITTVTGVTLSDGFYYGAQGKVTMAAGSVMSQSAATRVVGLIGQLDLSGSPTLTSGQISAIWADWGATAATPATAEANVLRVTNTTAAVINSLAYFYGKSSVIFDISDNSQGTIVIGTPPTTLSGSIKINANGNVRYIPLYTSAS